MTTEEAIKQLDKIWKSYTSAYDTISEEDVAAYDMAIEALEKQIPMKPMHPVMEIDGKKALPCGNCGESLVDGEYCSWCGQKVK